MEKIDLKKLKILYNLLNNQNDQTIVGERVKRSESLFLKFVINFINF